MSRWLADAEAALLSDVPGVIRLPILFLALLAAYFLGIAAASWRPAHETARIELLEERFRGIENHHRHLWGNYEALRKKQDRREAFGQETLALPTRGSRRSDPD